MFTKRSIIRGRPGINIIPGRLYYAESMFKAGALFPQPVYPMSPARLRKMQTDIRDIAA